MPLSVTTKIDPEPLKSITMFCNPSDHLVMRALRHDD